MRLLTAVVGAMALGCGTRSPPAVGNEAAPPAPADPAPVSRTYDPPPHFAALGGPCPPTSDALVECTICTDDGRVVAVVQPGDFLRLADDPAVVISTRRGDVGTWQWTIAISGGVVRAQVLTCPHCRRQMGWSVMIDLSALGVTPDATRAELQAALGYPASPLLTTEDEWRAATLGTPSRGVACDP